MPRWTGHRCACAFAKEVDDRNPWHFPRVGMADNVIYRGSWIIKHKESGRETVINRPGEGPLCAEADTCCFDWFDQTLDGPTIIPALEARP